MVFLARKWFFWQENGFSGKKMVFLAKKWFFWQKNDFYNNSQIFVQLLKIKYVILRV
jgi:hypothetical protein